MPYKQSKTYYENEIAKTAIKSIMRKSQALKSAGTDIIQDAFTQFSVPPIRSGLAQSKSTLAKIEQTSERTVKLVFIIAVSYAIYFVMGLGSNRKYGERNPVDKSLQTIKETVIDFIR